MDRDHGWIHTLLEEAENERMHLLTFLKLRSPGPIFRLSVILTQVKQGWMKILLSTMVANSLLQGLVMNLFFISYLVHPPLCHRSVLSRSAHVRVSIFEASTVNHHARPAGSSDTSRRRRSTHTQSSSTPSTKVNCSIRPPAFSAPLSNRTVRIAPASLHLRSQPRQTAMLLAYRLRPPAGPLQKWQTQAAPEIGISYWHLK